MTKYQIIALSISGGIVQVLAWLYMARFLYRSSKWSTSTQDDLFSSLFAGFFWFLIIPCSAVAAFVTAPATPKDKG